MSKATGVIKFIGSTEQVTDAFKKRAIVISVQEGQYTNDNAFELTQDRVSLGDQFGVGQEVTISYNIRSKEHKGRWFTNLQAWRIEAVQQQPVQHTQSANPPVLQAPSPQQPAQQGNDEDELPF